MPTSSGSIKINLIKSILNFTVIPAMLESSTGSRDTCYVMGYFCNAPIIFNYNALQGSKFHLSVSPGQVDFLPDN